jgi:hypothetical protein
MYTLRFVIRETGTSTTLKVTRSGCRGGRGSATTKSCVALWKRCEVEPEQRNSWYLSRRVRKEIADFPHVPRVTICTVHAHKYIITRAQHSTSWNATAFKALSQLD